MEFTLSDKIHQLRHAISEIEGLTDEKRNRLLQSIDELDQVAPAGDDHHLPLIDQLEESLLEVEAKHPDVAQLLRSLSDALGRMGL